MDVWAKSGRGLPQSKTWRQFGAARRTRSVLECASPLALLNAATILTWRRLGRACKRGRNLEGGFLPNAATPKRTGRALRNSQFAIRNCQGFFSGFHLGMDDWGKWRLNSRSEMSCSMLFDQEKELAVWNCGVSNPFVCPAHTGHDVFAVINF